jgi:hypothetical protein
MNLLTINVNMLPTTVYSNFCYELFIQKETLKFKRGPSTGGDRTADWRGQQEGWRGHVPPSHIY